MYNWKFMKKTAPAFLGAVVVMSGIPVNVFAEDVFTDTFEAAEASFTDQETSAFSEEPAPAEESSFTDDSQTVSQNSEYVYGKVNLPYADFYYGELNQISEDPEMKLDVADPVTNAGFRNSYDSVTSATTEKFKGFPTTYYTDNGNGGTIDGIADVEIAVPRSLYDAAQTAIKEGKTCNNKLLSIIENMTVLETAPKEYKVLNGDGTLGKMVTETVQDADAKAVLSMNSVWGNYVIDITSEYLPEKTDILGAVIETSDGARYGMTHLDNLWFRTGEIALTVDKDFTVPDGVNHPYSDRIRDIAGKTITKITYLRKDAADLEVDTNLYCKLMLSDNYAVTATPDNQEFNTSGNKVTLAVAAPEGSNFQLAGVSYGSKALTAGTDYTYADGILTILNTKSTGIGQYTVTFSDNAYEDMTAKFSLDAGLDEGAIVIENNKLVLNSDKITLANYLQAITAVSVDGKPVANKGMSFSLLFDENGNVNFDASLRGNRPFSKELGSSYELVITAPGYPQVKGTVVSPKPSITLNKSSVTLYTGGSTKVTLTPILENLTGDITYTTSDEKVATVSSKGVVTAKAKGTAVITAACGEYTATCKVTVKTPTITLSKSSITIAEKASQTLTVKSVPAGKVTYKSSNTKIASVNSKGVITGKKAGTAKITVTCNGVSKTCKITVKKQSVKVTKSSVAVKKGKTTKIAATASPAGKITYKSSNTKIASVNSKGVVTGKRKGTAKITVTCNGVKKTIKVTVK